MARVAASVRNHRGVPTLFIKGEPVDGTLYLSYLPDLKNFQEFAAAGYRLFGVSCNISDEGINSRSGLLPFRRPIWTAPGVYDFTDLDADLETVCRACPDALILLRVHLDAPSWWQRRYPDECNRLADGTALRQSFASRVWLAEAAEVLRAIIRHIEDGPFGEHVFGYHVAAGQTEEWVYHGANEGRLPDYSRPMREAWHRWLQVRYGSPGEAARAHAGAGGRGSAPAYAPAHVPAQALADTLAGSLADAPACGQARTPAAWDEWDAVELPSPEERRQFANLGELPDPRRWRRVLDYYRFHSEIVAAAVIHFCRHVKEATAGEALAGAFYGYVLEGVNLDFGHFALGQVLESEYVDFLCSPNSYIGGRQPGVDWAFFAPVDSVKLHGKLWFAETDTRTHLSQPLREMRPELDPNHWYAGGVWRGPEKPVSLANLKLNLGRALTHGVSMWWFDMWGGWFSDPEYMELMRRARQLMAGAVGVGGVEAQGEARAQVQVEVQAQARARVQAQAQTQAQAKAQAQAQTRASVAEVAVIVDERSLLYTSLPREWYVSVIYRQRPELSRAGAPWDVYLMTDLKQLPRERYRVFLFLTPWYMEKSDREWIRENLQRDDRWLVWVHAPGRLDENGWSTGAGDGDDLSGFTLRRFRCHSGQLVRLECPPELAGIRYGASGQAEMEYWTLAEGHGQEQGQALGPQQANWQQTQAQALAQAEAQARTQTHAQINAQTNTQTIAQAEAQADAAAPDAPPEVWGYWEETGEPAVAVKRFAGWTSVFTAAPCLPPALLRVIYREAGCHIYEEAGDTLYANRQFVAVRANEPGQRTILLPESCNVSDALTGRSISSGSREFTFDAGIDTYLFTLQPAEVAEAAGNDD